KAVLAALERCCGVPIPDRAYSLVYPQLLAKVVLAVGVAVLVAWSVRSRDPAQACLRVFAGWSLLSPTVYPWYLLWMLPWAALLARPAWLLLSVTSLFAYLPTLVGVALLPWPFLLVWVPPLALAMVLRRTS
ncbi:MAG: hypothetical protein R3190_00150, partial [Thermoanaerobaculia bacterium]|nr:hypothetical protein [Thermoanaerobaculia bacterium]